MRQTRGELAAPDRDNISIGADNLERLLSFFSDATRNDFVVKALARRFFKTQPDGGPRMSSRELFERLK